MYKIKNITIDNFWGRQKVTAKFDPDVNIFIGKNGTGKTTLINFLEAVLNADIYLLNNLEFNRVELNLFRGNATRKITVIKEAAKRPYTIYKFKISNRTYYVPSLLERTRIRRHMSPTRSREIREEYIKVKNALSEIVNVSWLSVHRGVDIGELGYAEDEEFEIRSSVDQRLKALTRQFITYQLSLSQESERLLSDFQNQVLESMLFNSQLDRANYSDLIKIDFSKEKSNLQITFEELGLNVKTLQPKIDRHFKEITTCIARIKDKVSIAQEKHKEPLFNLGDVLPIPLIARTQYIINIRKENKKQVSNIFRPIDFFIKLVNEYFKSTNKEIVADKEEGLTVIVRQQPVPIYQLSSGEKQLLIILLEALLQKNEPCLYIADEPEISLHVEWQEKLLDSIRKLNGQAQLIIATHSPEIVSDYGNKTIDMESLVHA